MALLGFALWFLLALDSFLGFALFSSGALMASIAPLALRKTSPTVASRMLGAVAFAGITGMAILRGGFPIQTLLWYAAIPSCALLITRRPSAVVAWSLLSLAAIVVFFVLHRTGHSIAPTIAQGTGATGYFVSLTVFTLFMLVVSRPIAEAHDRVGSERDELEQRLQQSQRLEGLGALAGGIAHDFGNVIAAITSSAQMLQYRLGPGDPGYREAQLILDTAERGTALTRQLLTFASRDFTEPEQVDINQSVTEMQALLARVLGHDIALSSELAAELPPVMIDPRQLDRVLLNLAINARDAMSEGGTLTLKTDTVHVEAELAPAFLELEEGTYVALEISDTGCGMPPEISARIFEPFFTTKEGRGGGAGLGLSSCYGIIKQARGAILVDSVEGEGTTFSIYLPAAETLPASDGVPLSHFGRGSGRILVIQDEPRSRRALERILSEHGYSVLAAANRDEAENLVRRQRGSIDLVLSQLVSGRMAQSELSRRFADERTPPPILYMAADQSVSHSPGEHVARPLGRSQLLARVQSALDSKGRPKNKA
jgi:signal transduction histidine kinase